MRIIPAVTITSTPLGKSQHPPLDITTGEPTTKFFIENAIEASLQISHYHNVAIDKLFQSSIDNSGRHSQTVSL
jgi:hypothetical protein